MAVLNIHFMNQSAPDIRHKLAKSAPGPQTPTQRLLEVAAGVFNRDTALRQENRGLRYRAEHRLKYWEPLVWVPHTTRLFRGKRRSQHETEIHVRPLAIGVDAGVKNIQFLVYVLQK